MDLMGRTCTATGPNARLALAGLPTAASADRAQVRSALAGLGGKPAARPTPIGPLTARRTPTGLRSRPEGAPVAHNRHKPVSLDTPECGDDRTARDIVFTGQLRHR